MTEHVRIKDPDTGHEYTYDTAKVVALGLEEHVIDRDPYGPDGRPAPVKHRVEKGEPAPGSTAAKRAARTTATSGGTTDDGPKSAATSKEK